MISYETQGYQVIFADEVMFTSSTNQAKTWAPKNNPITIEQ